MEHGTGAISVNTAFSVERAEWREGGFLHGAKLDLARDVVHGFNSATKRISSRWLYDAEGLRLFSEVLKLPEYTSAVRESEILKRYSPQLSARVGKSPLTLIELDPRESHKTALLMNVLKKSGCDFAYRPVDLARVAVENLQSGFRREGDRILVSYLGSGIGHLSRAELVPFLSRIRSVLSEGDLVLIGFDMIKDVARMTRAYADSDGVSRAFHMNLLTRLNRELGAELSCSSFAYEALWNPRERCMESWLFSKRDQNVRFSAIGREFHFKKWEGLLVGSALKFESNEIGELGLGAGFEPVEIFRDGSGEFTEVLWRVGATAPTTAH